MVRAFDPELHLRLAGERVVLDACEDRPMPWVMSLEEVAAALAAVGALPEDRAREIADDYRVALGLRGRGPMLPPSFRRPGTGRVGGTPPAALHVARVVACEAALDVAGWRVEVHVVTLTEETTTLAVSASGGPPPRRPQAPGPGAGMGPPLRVVRLADDRGRRVTARFSGRGSPRGWYGLLTGDGPLSVGTRWIEVGADRVALGEVASPTVTVEVEALPDASPAERYLRGRLTAGRHGPHGGPRPPMIDVAVATLVEAGALAPDSPVIAEVQDVVAAFSGQAPASPLAEPWSSLVAAIATQSDWSFVLPLGVVTPELGGTAVAVDALLACEGVVEAHVRVAPATALGQAPRPDVVAGALAWWAVDDLGNPYLGSVENWRAGAEVASGTVVYWPALHPRARQLVLLPTAGDRRARIAVDLPQRANR